MGMAMPTTVAISMSLTETIDSKAFLTPTIARHENMSGTIRVGTPNEWCEERARRRESRRDVQSEDDANETEDEVVVAPVDEIPDSVPMTGLNEIFAVEEDEEDYIDAMDEVVELDDELFGEF